MSNPDKNKEPIPEPSPPDKQQPGREDPIPVQPPPDKPEIEPIPDVPERDVPRKPADPQANPGNEQAFKRQYPAQK
ncbi:hypothetical protein CLV51_101384 [Chitinophaga niastensis]|uniref:Uncharacterized protein n=1 Tax=Chitinophaga niastensis TaxID=536980 RepID=A0A2P8HSA1_CHINA|nr:hypothetical protein [Chitinophaga niastensis]PSL49054.1 hypothetical protein CLV51_101384 [Chitinophaga niastensis]